MSFTERFAGASLDRSRWLPHYLPQWTTPDRSAARFDLTDEGLRLRIDANQPAWAPETGPLRVSNLQTAVFSGPVGSGVGTHRPGDGWVVRSAWEPAVLWSAEAGRVAVRMSGPDHPDCMLAAWLVGIEQSGADDAGELCIAELFGDRIGQHGSSVSLGVKQIRDPRLRSDVVEVSVSFDARSPHEYAVEWAPGLTTFSIDGVAVHSSPQAPEYPMQLMLDLFEFPTGSRRSEDAYPKTAVVHEVRADSR